MLRTLKPVAADMVSKMECLWKPAQSGKTKAIQEMIREDDGLRNHLNIVICSKNRLLAAQTAKRMESARDDMESQSVDTDDLDGDDEIVGDVYCWMSGTKKTNITAHDLALRVLLGEVSMIVCCSHRARFQYLHDLLDLLERFSAFKKPVNVWLDEADAYVNLWADDFDFTRRRSVRKVIPVSATFDNVLERFGRIKVKALPVTHPLCYRGLRDCEFAEHDYDRSSPTAYLAAMLDRYSALAVPGMRLFTPGAMSVKTHNAIAKELLKRGFAVMILNGRRKGFLLPRAEFIPDDLSMNEYEPFHPIELSADGDELAQVLAEKYVELGLERYPFAVTGHLCLNRGITFQSRGFLFDAGIIPSLGDDATAYQCIARMLGNVGEFPDSKAPLVITSPRMKAATTRQERIATRLAQLVHENEWADVGKDEVERAAHDTEESYLASQEMAAERRASEEREAEEAALAERETVVERSREYISLEDLRTERKGKLPSAMANGYYRNVTGSKKPMSRAEFEAWVVNKTAQGHHRLERGDETSRVVVFYEDVADPSTARFVVRTLRRSDPGAVGPAAAGGLPA